MTEITEPKERIRQKAHDLFMQYGLRSVSMDDIASALGVSKKTIYQFFADKDELVGEVIKVIIAGAGGAAHLPGMIASLTPLPVIGVPVKSSSNATEGWDSLLSILQMPGGVPVATVAINGAKNAGILAAQIIGSSDKAIQDLVGAYKREMKEEVDAKSENLQKSSKT